MKNKHKDTEAMTSKLNEETSGPTEEGCGLNGS